MPDLGKKVVKKPWEKKPKRDQDRSIPRKAPLKSPIRVDLSSSDQDCFSQQKKSKAVLIEVFDSKQQVSKEPDLSSLADMFLKRKQKEKEQA